MTLADELERLAKLRSSGALSEYEFETAKRKLLAAEQAITPAPVDHLSELQLQNEVAQLDRQWQISKDKYLVHGRYGSRIPSKGSSVAQGLVVGAFGVFWTIMALSIAGGVGAMSGSAAPLFFPAFGVIFTVYGIVSAIHAFNKAEQYEQAEKAYQEERARLLRK